MGFDRYAANRTATYSRRVLRGRMNLRRFGIALGTLVLTGTLLGAGPDLDAAKREGVVVWYTTMNTNDLALTVAEFGRTHPGITLKPLRMGSAQLPPRVLTEQKAGSYNADVLTVDLVQLAQLQSAGALQPYKIPEADRFLPGTVDPNGWWANSFMNTTVLAWNPARLQSDHLAPPRSLADLAKPEWRGKFAVDTAALNWYLGTIDGDKKDGAALLKRLGENQPLKTEGHTQSVVQLEAGEFDATPTVYGYMAQKDRRAGRPIAYLIPKPLIVSLNATALAKNAPHPDAAKVFMDWQLSREGQQWMVEHGLGHISSRTDVRNDAELWDAKRPYVIVRPPSPAQYNAAVRAFRQLFGPG